jgi:K+-transporting ATPase KdpF subunit
MDAELLLAGIAAFLLLIYLTFSMLHPEKF